MDNSSILSTPNQPGKGQKYDNADFRHEIQIQMRPVQDFAFEKNWWNKSNVEEYHKNMTKVKPQEYDKGKTTRI